MGPRARIPIRGIVSIVDVAPWKLVDKGCLPECLFAVDVASPFQGTNCNPQLDVEALVQHGTICEIIYVIDGAGPPERGQAMVHSLGRNLLHSWPQVTIEKVGSEGRMARTIDAPTIDRDTDNAVAGAKSGRQKVFALVPFEADRSGGI